MFDRNLDVGVFQDTAQCLTETLTLAFFRTDRPSDRNINVGVFPDARPFTSHWTPGLALIGFLKYINGLDFMSETQQVKPNLRSVVLKFAHADAFTRKSIAMMLLQRVLSQVLGAQTSG